MSTEGEACTWVSEFHYYPILSCLISNNSRCVDITRTYLLLRRLSQTGRENREESQSRMTASPQSSYLHDSQAIAQEQKLLKHHYRNALVSMAYFPQMSGFLAKWDKFVGTLINICFQINDFFQIFKQRL